MKASEGIQNYKAKVKECVNYCVKEIKYVCKEIGGREPMVKDIVVQPGVPYVFTLSLIHI